MFGSNRLSAFDSFLNLQREMDRMFNQFWTELPAQTAVPASPWFHVTSDEDAWKIEYPIPGIDPQHVSIEAAGNTLTIRAQAPEREGSSHRTFEQRLTVPNFLNLDKVSAGYRHGMLLLTIPLRDSVKPRRIEIENVADDKKQLTAVA